SNLLIGFLAQESAKPHNQRYVICHNGGINGKVFEFSPEFGTHHKRYKSANSRNAEAQNNGKWIAPESDVQQLGPDIKQAKDCRLNTFDWCTNVKNDTEQRMYLDRAVEDGIENCNANNQRNRRKIEPTKPA